MNEQLPITQVRPMGDVLSAVAKAAGQIKRVAKDGKNTHDNYGFASIDGFLEMVRPICAEAGLVITMDEVEIEDFARKGKYGESQWMRVRWEIVVYHISGQSMPASYRTVEVLRNGAQAYGSAQSYALKQFLRALLQIATGDKDDADLAATDDGQIERPKPQQQQRQEPSKQAAPSERADKMIDALKAKGLSVSEQTTFQTALDALRKASPEDAARVEFTVQELTPNPNADIDGDHIPY